MSMGTWGSRAGWNEAKAGDGGAKVLRKRGYVSDTEDEELRVGKKGGQIYGAENWWEQDLMVMLDLVEELLPAGKKEWVRLYEWFARWAEENDCPMQSSNTIEKWFKMVCCHFSFLQSR